MKRAILTALLVVAGPVYAIEETLTQGSPTSSEVLCGQGMKIGYLYRGTFDSATAKIQSEDADGDWNDVPDTSATSADGGVVQCFVNSRTYRVTTTGGGGSQSIEIEFEPFSESSF